MQNRSLPADIKLLVLDIDGTIAGVENEIRQPVIQAIRAAQAKGIKVAIATGRMYCAALRFYEAVGSTLPLMAYQGAWIQEPATQTIHRHWTVPKSLVLQLLDYFEQPELRSLLSVHFYINDQLYVRELTSETKEYAKRSGVQPIPVGDLRTALTAEPTKVLALSDDTALITTLLGSLQSRYTPAELYLTKSVATFFEATNPLVSKGTAVRYLAEEYLGLKAENVMAIGDNFNDVEMIEYAGIGVAMGNAPDAVKALANWVAPDVEKDGSAAAIEEFLL
ncbi:HAD family phosphatase [Phormidium sp. FACHB-592]|uniref:Cof-type HAD-IIB family hydrolase n=1 Tax=Stenomitos frigidus AS-A4 TaxID=2933935 RepID=A0ABV0KK95_9CYAN|nr:MULTISPECIES: Cof-type HAD-IIB family hydrolase [Cyanophyceae]MBD2036054.1 HAD family phosphatase [Leptolyngbya sp. FACHB-321]MBD2076945.1 HAD family phosphatase [Phormidium sp. FACHB-592]